MATEPPAPWTLFDDGLSASEPDQRSVGEMLWAADHGARELLCEVGGEDAATLLRAWPTVITAGRDLWDAIPETESLNLRVSNVDRIEQLHVASAAVVSSLDHEWPHHGDSDARMKQIASDLNRSARLVRRYGRQAPTRLPDVRQDIAAARTRTMHTLYVATHAVIVALHQHGQDEYREARRAGSPVAVETRHSPYTAGAPGRWITRLSACESLAGGYIAGRYPHVLANEARPTAADADRFERALTRWDIQVHRTLAHSSNAADIEAVARTEGGIASGGQVLIAGAHAGGSLPPAMATAQLEPALGRSAAAWRELANRWSDLRTPADPPEADLASAASELRAAFRELAHDATTMVPLDVIAERPTTAAAATAVVGTVEAIAERAHIVAEYADNPSLTGPARAVSLRAQNDVDAGLSEPVPGDAEGAWVSPVDIAARRMIPLPVPVAAGLRAASARVLSTTSSAAATATIHTTRESANIRESHRAAPKCEVPPAALSRPSETKRSRALGP